MELAARRPKGGRECVCSVQFWSPGLLVKGEVGQEVHVPPPAVRKHPVSVPAYKPVLTVQLGQQLTGRKDHLEGRSVQNCGRKCIWPPQHQAEVPDGGAGLGQGVGGCSFRGLRCGVRDGVHPTPMEDGRRQDS